MQAPHEEALRPANFRLPTKTLEHLDQVYHRLRFNGLQITKQGLVAFAINRLTVERIREEISRKV